MVTLSHLRITHKRSPRVTLGHLTVIVCHLRVTVGHSLTHSQARVTLSHLLGSLQAAVGKIRVTIGHLGHSESP